jgi:uncharacterized protein (TIGR02246 family)
MKRMSCLALAPLAPLAFLAACGPSADADDVTETLRLTEAAHHDAIAAKDVDGVMKLYRDDAVVVVPNTEPASGGTAIRAYFEGMVKDPNLTIEATPGQTWTASAGDLAVTTYTATFTHTDPETGQRRKVSMNNQTVWTKDTGSSWKIVSDYNVLLPDAGDTVAGRGDAVAAAL